MGFKIIKRAKSGLFRGAKTKYFPKRKSLDTEEIISNMWDDIANEIKGESK